MTRKQSLEPHIRCNTCKNCTQSIEPVVIKKESGNRFHFKAVCVICNKFKIKYLNLEQVKHYQRKLGILMMVQLSQILLYVMMKFFLLYL